MSQNAIDELRVRVAYCLAAVHVGECPECETAKYVSDHTVIEMMHHEDCGGGCLEKLPSVCRDCLCIFL